MSDITEHHSDLVAWQPYYSTNQRRIVVLSGRTPLFVPPVGVFRPRLLSLLLKNYDNLRFVAIGPHLASISVRDISTKDGIPCAGDIAVEYRVVDSDAALLRLAADPQIGFEVFAARVRAAAARIIAAHDYNELIERRPIFGSKLIEAFAVDANDPMSLQLTRINHHTIDTTDPVIRDDKAAERAGKIEADRKSVAFNAQLIADAAAKRQDLKLMHEKAQILKAEEGQMAENLQAVLQYKAQIAKNVANFDLQAHENLILRSIVKQTSNINLAETTKVIENLASDEPERDSDSRAKASE